MDVSYRPEVVRINRDAVTRNLIAVSSDGATYAFASPNDGLGALKQGSVMLLEGFALRKVTSVTPAEGGLVVATKPAQLSDAISKGSIHFESKIDVAHGHVSPRGEGDPPGGGASEPAPSDVPAPSASPAPTDTPAPADSPAPSDLPTPTDAPTPADSPSPAAYRLGGGAGQATVASQHLGLPDAQGGGGTSGSRKGYKYDVSYTVSGGNLNAHLALDKEDTAVGSVHVTVDGHLGTFTMAGDLTFADNKFVTQHFNTKDLQGSVDVSWDSETHKSGTLASNDVIKIPYDFNVGQAIGGLPIGIAIGLSIQVAPALSTNGIHTHAHIHADFSNLPGYSASGGAFAVDQSGGGADATSKATEPDGTTGPSPAAFIVTVAFPILKAGVSKAPSFVETAYHALPAKYQIFQKYFDSVGPHEPNDDSEYSFGGSVELLTQGIGVTEGSLSLVPCGAEAITLIGKARFELDLVVLKGAKSTEFFKHVFYDGCKGALKGIGIDVK